MKNFLFVLSILILTANINQADNLTILNNCISYFGNNQLTAMLPFSDDFTNGAKPEWNVIGNFWEFQNNQVYSNIDPSYQYEYMMVGDQSWTDYTFEVDLKATSGTDKAVAFRVQDSQNFYFLHLIGPIQYHHLELQKYVNGSPGTPTNLYQDSNYPVQNNVNYHIKVEAYGSSIKVYINGVLEIDIIDNTYQSGGIALLGGWNGYAPCYVQFDNVSIYNEFEPQYGQVAGTITSNNLSIENILVKLLDDNGLPVVGIDDQYTDSNGEYSFTEVPEGNYQVMIVEPLGYIVDQNPKLTEVLANETSIVDFNLTEIVLVNAARSKGYWKHQFDVYVRGRGNAQETEQELLDYIGLIHQHYSPHFDLFSGSYTLEDWQNILSLKGNHPMIDRAKQHLAALLMNMVSGKVGQYTIVTEDSRDVGDVIQYVSILIGDGDDMNDELAKDLAENINNQQTIASGIVPEGSILFKENSNSKVISYSLSQNFPNPFNPMTTIEYQIPSADKVSLKVYDILGNEITNLVDQIQQPGYYQVEFEAAELPSGVYVYRLQAGDFINTMKMILLK